MLFNESPRTARAFAATASFSNTFPHVLSVHLHMGDGHILFCRRVGVMDIARNVPGLRLDERKREVFWALARHHCLDALHRMSRLISDYTHALAQLLE